jgi:hypothetical protein
MSMSYFSFGLLFFLALIRASRHQPKTKQRGDKRQKDKEMCPFFFCWFCVFSHFIEILFVSKVRFLSIQSMFKPQHSKRVRSIRDVESNPVVSNLNPFASKVSFAGVLFLRLPLF